MLHLLPFAFAAAFLYYIFATYKKFSENLAQAKQSGIPYFCSPVYVRSRSIPSYFTSD